MPQTTFLKGLCPCVAPTCVDPPVPTLHVCTQQLNLQQPQFPLLNATMGILIGSASLQCAIPFQPPMIRVPPSQSLPIAPILALTLLNLMGSATMTSTWSHN